MSHSTPVILVTAPLHDDGQQQRVRLGRAYLIALECVGLLPVVSAPPRDVDAHLGILSRVQGLVLSGGADIDPTRYGATPHPALGPLSPARDAWEIALVHEARRLRVPTLAICRGVQIVNVAFGGTLVQDIPDQRQSTIVDHFPKGPRDMRSHALTVEGGTRLAHAIGIAPPPVNSIHHQAVDRVAPGFRAVAHARDGIIEAIEPADGPDSAWWMLGVQWHPEELEGASGGTATVFGAFAEAVRRREKTAEAGIFPHSGEKSGGYRVNTDPTIRHPRAMIP